MVIAEEDAAAAVEVLGSVPAMSDAKTEEELEEGVDAKEARRVASCVNAIVERMQEKSWPPVHPRENGGPGGAHDAASVWALMSDTETAKVQRFMNTKAA